MNRHYPPYGKLVAEALLTRLPINLFVIAGRNAWQRAKRRQQAPSLTLVYDGTKLPSQIRWPVRGLWVTVVWDNADRYQIDALASALLEDGADRVTALFPSDKDGYILYRPMERVVI
jgi:hypothetical protein